MPVVRYYRTAIDALRLSVVCVARSSTHGIDFVPFLFLHALIGLRSRVTGPSKFLNMQENDSGFAHLTLVR